MKKELICPLVKGECIGVSCIGCKERIDEYVNGGDKYYVCSVFDTVLNIKENDKTAEQK